MIIWRGAGVFALIIFGLIYLGGFALDVCSPSHFMSGYYIFIWAILGGVITWKIAVY